MIDPVDVTDDEIALAEIRLSAAVKAAVESTSFLATVRQARVALIAAETPYLPPTQPGAEPDCNHWAKLPVPPPGVPSGAQYACPCGRNFILNRVASYPDSWRNA